MIKALLVHAITDLNQFLNFQNIMTTPQIAETAIMILNDFNALKIDDIRVCLSNGKKGYYGALFGRMDGQIIMMWLAQYSTDRTNEFLRIRDLAEKQRLNQKIDVSEINPEGQKKVIEILSQYAKKVDVRVEKPIVEKTEGQKLIQRFMSQFDKLWAKRDYEANGGRFIKRYGRIIGQVEYVEYKLNQIQIINKRKLGY
jgi:hypothetical protein